MLNVTEVEHVGAAAERDKGCCPTCLEAMEMRILTIGFGEIGREVTEALSKARIHSPGLYLVSEVTDSIHLKQRLDDYLIHNIVTEYSAVLISGEWSSNSKMDLWISKLCIELHARNKFSIAFIADDYLVKSQKKARCSAAGVDAFIVSPGGATVGRTTILNTVRNTLDTYLTIYNLLHGGQLVCVDYSDVRTILSAAGETFCFKGFDNGKDGAREAARNAVYRMREDGVSLADATGVIVAVMGPSDMSLTSVNDACSVVEDYAHEGAQIIFGTLTDQMDDQFCVQIIATGFSSGRGPNELQI